jgi:hypothetical protein
MPDEEDGLAKTRRRSANISRLMDLIPARYYLDGDLLHMVKAYATLDPAKVKTTSQMVEEAARAEGGSASDSSKGSKKRKNRQRSSKSERGSAAGRMPMSAEAETGSRQELREKLERRIKELREERRQRQSATDKAHAAEILTQRQKDEPRMTAQTTPLKKGAAAGSEIEAGKLIFTPKQSDLPFEASMNKRGAKVRQLRTSLREEEVSQRRIREAEAAGRGDEVRRDVAMNKALMRARGEKVHDNTTKIRKSQKFIEKKKLKGKDAWKDRKEAMETQAEEKQARRKENLQNRGSKKKKKNAAAAAATVSGGDGRGFEGKGTGFLNKGVGS